MALTIAAVPVLTGEASDRFDLMMEQSESYITPCLVPCEVLFYKKKAENDTLTL